MGSFVYQIEEIKRRARESLEQGAVTGDNRADRDKVIGVLNTSLATEIVCVLRYRRHYEMASGHDMESVRAEFLEHAQEEQKHVDWLAERITQLGGEPDFNPNGLAERACTDYVECETLVEMIKENLVAERIVIQLYTEMIRDLKEDDPTTRRILEKILAEEEEHADDLKSFLDKMDLQKEKKAPQTTVGAPRPQSVKPRAESAA